MSVQLGKIGVWTGAFAVAPAAEARPAAREIEELGYDTLWYAEGLGTRESFSNGAVLLGATERLRVASGIANIWGRDAVSAANAARVLADEQKVLLDARPVEARGRARAALAWYLDTPNYVDNLRWLGFSDVDFEGGGSDTLVDALVVAGDEQAIQARVHEHLDAGATQVAIHPIEDDPFGRETLRRLAPVLHA